MNDTELDAELRSPFPSPPSHYTKYTTQNLTLLDLLRERAEDVFEAELDQHQILSDQPDVPEWPLTQLEKPRVDWILEEGHYTVFGDTWFLKEKIPSLEELGGNQLYPADPSIDRRPALLSVLRSSLVTYSSLLRSLLSPPPPEPHPPEWGRHVEWITVLAQNMMAAVNDLRPVQARANLEQMMTRQLELRREETKKIHEKCDALEAKLADLRTMTRLTAENAESADKPSEQDALPQPVIAHPTLAATPRNQPLSQTLLTTDDVRLWAESQDTIQ